MDLQIGKNSNIQIISSIGGLAASLNGDVREGGKIGGFAEESFLIATSIGQDFWISKGAKREVVKMSANGVILKLTSKGIHDFEKPKFFGIDNSDIDFTLPPNWFAKQKKVKAVTYATLYSPISRLSAHFESRSKSNLPEDQQTSARAFADAYLKKAKNLQTIKDFTVIGEPVEVSVGGNPGVEVIVTFTSASLGKRKEYILWVMGKNGSRFKFTTSPEKFDLHLHSFKKIALSLTE